MRIDYSEPKRSFSSPQGNQPRPRKESGGGGGAAALAVTSIISLIIGFGGGWVVSQRSAKKEFKAKMEQVSLESSAKQEQQPPVSKQPPPPPPGTTAQPPAAPSATPQPGTGAPGTPAGTEPPLSFYKTLPSGQKSTVLGSGINTKVDKPAKQPLQAALPANLAKPVEQSGDDSAGKPAVPAGNSPAKPASSGKPDANGYTVQVASYSLKSEAEGLRSTLAAKGYNVGIVESHLGDKGTWYRVRVGKKLDAEAAKELAKKLGKGALAIPDKE